MSNASPTVRRDSRVTVDGTMNYLAPMDETPFVAVWERGRDRLSLEPHRVRFTDARPIEGDLDLDREGFRLVRHRTSLAREDFLDPKRIEAVYLDEIANLVKAETGADRVVPAAGPLVRHNVPDDAAVKPASIAHSDYTDFTLRTLMGFQLDPAAPELSAYRKVVAIQTWRALSPPPQDNTLALCDAQSVSVDDRVLSHFEIAEPAPATLEFYMYRYNPAHRWYYFSDLREDEVILFKGFEGEGAECGHVLHGAFDLPPNPNAVPRQSIETRTYAFFR